MSSAAAASPDSTPPGALCDVEPGVKTLLLGMGNPILSDDGVGIRLAQELAGRLPPTAGLAVEEQCTVGGLNLLDLFTGFFQLILLDFIKTTVVRAGDWYRFDGSALRETMNLSNVHDANFATAMELGRRMGMRVPDATDIHVFAVEVMENLTFCERLSPELEEALPELVEEMHGEILALLDMPPGGGSRPRASAAGVPPA
jgi:hydrogenase maturation protease